jgi:hypothetical protein
MVMSMCSFCIVSVARRIPRTEFCTYLVERAWVQRASATKDAELALGQELKQLANGVTRNLTDIGGNVDGGIAEAKQSVDEGYTSV